MFLMLLISPKEVYLYILTFGCFLVTITSTAQCTGVVANAGITPVTPNTTVSATSNIQPGQYFLMNVESGGNYTLSTCNTSPSFDTQLTITQIGGGVVLGYNDDSCGLSSEVSFTSPFTGQLEVRLHEYSCAANTSVSSAIEYSGIAPDSAPTLTATGNQTYCPGTGLSVVETISITDSDDTNLISASIQISSGYINGEDLLTLTGSHPNITPIWSVDEGKLTLNGPASLTEFETAIIAVEYSSSAGIPNGTREFSITTGEANFLPATGHYYEYISDIGITWTAARDAAALRTYYGLQGYLATLTTQEEADFSGSQALGTGWIGASDAAIEGDWRWVTGPEAGTPFWTGRAAGNTVAPYNYANWNGNEPNQSGNEDYAHITDPSVVRGSGGLGSWNDLRNTGSGSGAYQPKGYVVEYGGTVGDPVLDVTDVTVITIDNIDPTASNPAPLTVSCLSEVPVSDISVVIDETDNCTTNPTITFVSDSSDGGSNPEIITRIYSVTDEANNSIDVTQIITISPILIDLQPSNQSAFVGNNATFTSSTSNTDTYQWQVSVDNGISFTTITDGADYSGTSTEIVTVLSPDINKNGYMFRVLVSNSTSTCPFLISVESTLTTQVRTVITNRRITHRVKRQ